MASDGCWRLGSRVGLAERCKRTGSRISDLMRWDGSASKSASAVRPSVQAHPIMTRHVYFSLCFTAMAIF